MANGQQQIAAPAPGAPAPAPAPAGAARGNDAATRGREIWKRLTAAGMRVIYTPEGAKALVAQMASMKANPVQAVAAAVVTVMQRVMADVKGIDPRLAAASVPAWTAMLFELAHKAGLFTGNPKMMAAVVQLVGKMMSGGPAQPQQAAPPPGAAPGGLVAGAMPAAAPQPAVGG